MSQSTVAWSAHYFRQYRGNGQKKYGVGRMSTNRVALNAVHAMTDAHMAQFVWNPDRFSITTSVMAVAPVITIVRKMQFTLRR
jgi:hypothetical protein